MAGYTVCCYFLFLCPVTDISTTVALIGVKFTRWYTYRSRTGLFPFWEPCPYRDPPNRNLLTPYGGYCALVRLSVCLSPTTCTTAGSGG